MFNIEYCKTKKGFEAKLKKPKKLELNKIKKQFKVIGDAGITLVIKEENEEIIIQQYGSLLFKATKDKEKAEKIAKKIFKVGLNE